MEKRSWSEIEMMNEEGLKHEFLEVAKAIENLSEQTNLTTVEEKEQFVTQMRTCFDTLEDLKLRTVSMYYDKIKVK